MKTARRRTTLLVPTFLLLFLHSSVTRGEQQLSEQVEVRVTSVDVVVTDSSGRRVRGLGQDKFEVRQGGKVHEITNFSEILVPEAATEKAPTPRRFVLYIDNYSLTPSNRAVFLTAAKSFFHQDLRPGDEVMVATWNRAFSQKLAFTGDRTALDKTLDEVAKMGGTTLHSERRSVMSNLDNIAGDSNFSQSLGQGQLPTYPTALASTRHYAAARMKEVESAIKTLGALVSAMAGLPGKKVLILAGESLPTRPGAEMFQHLENLKGRLTGVGTSMPLLESGQYDVTSEIASLAGNAAKSRVSIYAVNPRGTGQPSSSPVENQDAGESNVEFRSTSEGIEGYQILANRTGGLALIGTNVQYSFDQIHQDLSSYYSIGFRPTDPGGRPIEVRLKDAEGTVRTSRGSLALSAAEEVRRQVLLLQGQSPARNELGISLRLGEIESLGGTKRKVPLLVMIPISNLKLDAEGETVTGGFTVFFCSGNGKGAMSDVNSQAHEIKWPREALAQIVDKSITYKVEIVQDQPRDRITVGVLDRLSEKSGFAVQDVPQ